MKYFLSGLVFAVLSFVFLEYVPEFSERVTSLFRGDLIAMIFFYLVFPILLFLLLSLSWRPLSLKYESNSMGLYLVGLLVGVGLDWALIFLLWG